MRFFAVTVSDIVPRSSCLWVTAYQPDSANWLRVGHGQPVSAFSQRADRGKSRSQRPPKPAILEPLVTKATASQTSVERRAEELDTIASALPLERRDALAELLTDQDVETLRHLVNQGMGDNTLRALISDLAYLEAWRLAITGNSLPWAAPEALLLEFVAITSGTRKNAQQIPTTACQLRSMKTSGVRAF